MKRNYELKYLLWVALAAMITSFTATQTNLMAEVTVVANPSVSDEAISASDVENIFLGKKKSLPSGTKVKVVVLKSGAAHDEFLSSYVNKTSSQFSAFWKRKIVDGTGIPPKSFASEADLIAYVKTKSDTIGYVSAGTTTDGVKTIQVQ